VRTILLPGAIADLESIGDYIARDNPRRAASYVAELRRQCVKIAGNPAGYRLRPEVADGIRSCAYGNYVIFFTVDTDALLIVRILHGGMDIDTQFSTTSEH
jgi:toxin ParE1/3/4